MDPKSLTTTSFCDKEIDNVTDNNMKKYILDNLFTKSNLKYNNNYAKLYNDNFSRNSGRNLSCGSIIFKILSKNFRVGFRGHSRGGNTFR